MFHSVAPLQSGRHTMHDAWRWVCRSLVPPLGAALLVGSTAFAQPEPLDSDRIQSSSAARGNPHAGYWQDFNAARQALLDGEDERAAREFEALEKRAPTAEERRVVEEFAALARSRLQTRARQLPSPHVRTADEMSVLYTTAFTYGFGTSAWLVLQLEPQSFAAAVLPFVAITTASVGGVALVDQHRPFRLGVPQSISTGISLGFLEGVLLVGYEHARTTRKSPDERWRASTVSTLLWVGATIGGIAGGTLGALGEPTPGQVSYAASSAVWGGIVSSLVGAALQPAHDRRAETAFASGAAGYNVGLISGLLTAPHVRPSVARMRLTDLGGLAGGLLGIGSYLTITGDDATNRGGLISSAVGGLIGLGVAWWVTSDMPSQTYPQDNTLTSRLAPLIVPVDRGAVGVIKFTL